MENNVINKLASSLGRRDEKPNQEMAQLIVKNKDKKAVKILIENLSNKNNAIQSDCIKVLYEIGEKNPMLIADYDIEFLELLNSKNNRLVWGAMIALDYITSVNPGDIYKNLNKIIDTSDKGSVITKDHAVGILIKLAAEKKYSDEALTLLLDLMKSCATNQLPMYAENALSVISEKHKKSYMEVLTSRLKDIEKETKQKRVEKVIKKLGIEKSVVDLTNNF